MIQKSNLASTVFLSTLMVLSSCISKTQKGDVAESKPNVLLIAIDDLNDWIGCLGGHPQAQTPNIDRLAGRGVLFSNAHCQTPVCNPSRASLMTSLYPSTSGIYFLNPDLQESPVASASILMPQRFLDEGYHVSGVGKLFHNGGGQNERYVPNYGGQFGGFGPMPEEKLSTYPGHPLWDWGVYPEHDEDMPDYKIAHWAVEALRKSQEKPWWMGVGFYRPHVPQFATQKWFDMYPLEDVQLPKIMEDDLDDISTYGVDITRLKHVSPPHDWVVNNDAWKPLVQSYLACVSFVDEQVGKVMDELAQSPYANDTYVVLFSDHGFHLGEKERFAKRSLWEDGARVPMIITGPGISKGRVCSKPVQLLDVYPTLLELIGAEPDPRHDGHSLKPLLQDPEAPWPHMARTSFGPGNYAIISENHRYIRYQDGSDEFYDHTVDPYEWYNVVSEEKYKPLVQKHASLVPTQYHRILGEGSTGHLSFYASQIK